MFSPSLSRDGRDCVAYVTSSIGVDHLNIAPVSGGPAADLLRNEAKLSHRDHVPRDNRSIAYSKHSNTREISMIHNFK